MHRVRVGPQRKEEGWYTNLLDEVQEQTAKIEEESIGRDEQVVAASSGMWGEKYRDEVGLGRNDGDDLLDELAGDQAIKEAPARGEVRDRHRALCRTLGDRVRVRNAGQTLPWRSRKRGPLLCSPQMVVLRQLKRVAFFF